MNKYEKAIEYFGGDELAGKAFINKYALKKGDADEDILELTPTQMHWRLANEFARIESKYPNELSAQEIFDLLDRFKYLLPQGSPMAGIGNNYQTVSISNCFVVGNEFDSYGSIYRTDEEQTQLMKRRGGVGHDLSHIRPKGVPVKNSALVSTGLVPFMERYSNSTREVAQDGRRGALMLSVSVNHPDAEGFIDAKLEQGKVTGANVSVKITDDFMKSVINKSNFVQSFPISEAGKWNNLLDHEMGFGTKYLLNELIECETEGRKVFNKIKDSEELWRKIIHNAWKSAEPGVLFWDTIIRESVPDCYGDLGFKTISTNPCVTGDTTILVQGRGFRNISDYIDETNVVWNGKEWTMVTPFKTSDLEKVYLVKFSDGSELKCTNYHKFILKGDIRKELKDTKIGDKLEKFIYPVCEFEEHMPFNEQQWYTQGFYSGDGTIAKEEGRNDRYFIDLYGNKKDLLIFLDGEQYGNIDKINDKVRAKVNIIFPDKTKVYPEISIKNRLAYLAGVIDSDGTLNDSGGSIAITSINKQFLYDLKSLLITLGIRSSLGINKEEQCKNIKGSDYNCKTCYRLTISAWEIKKLIELGLKTNRVPLIANPNRDASRFITIDSIEYIGEEPVYCFTDPKNNSGLFNHIMTANCGEIPLCPYDSCRLLAVNLYSYVVNPFKEDAYFDFELFKKHVTIAQRLMDDIVDIELEKIDAILTKIESDPEDDDIRLVEKNLWLKIKDKCINGRRTGLGITAEGDMIAAMGLRYGTEEATDFAEEVHKQLAITAYKSSIILAEERGAFPIFDFELEKNNPFIYRILENFSDEELFKYYRYGRRNIACLTIKCGGSIK